MGQNAENEILFGSGDLYIVPEGVDFDTDTEEEIEDALIKIGESSGETSLNFTQEFVDVKGGAKNQTLATFATNEEIMFNAGVVTFDLSKFKEILPAYFEENETERRMGLGGIMTIPIQRLRFVHHKKADGKRIILDMFRAMNQSGLQMTFNPEQESVFQTEFKLLPDRTKDQNKGNVLQIIEEL